MIEKTGANLGQSIFHRPASSGIYAIVCHLELSRIGYNDIKQEYAIDEDARQQRASLLLESLLYTFLELNGAMRSTQLPHLVALEGVLTMSSSTVPAPLISPLIGGDEDLSNVGDDKDTRKAPLYQTQLAEIVSALNGGGNSVNIETFETIGKFASHMRTVVDTIAPLRLAVGR